MKSFWYQSYLKRFLFLIQSYYQPYGFHYSEYIQLLSVSEKNVRRCFLNNSSQERATSLRVSPIDRGLYWTQLYKRNKNRSYFGDSAFSECLKDWTTPYRYSDQFLTLTWAIDSLNQLLSIYANPASIVRAVQEISYFYWISFLLFYFQFSNIRIGVTANVVDYDSLRSNNRCM